MHPVSSSWGDFRQRVAARDSCVITGTLYVQAYHIVPHTKGHKVHSEYLWNHSESSFQAQYIINFASPRHEVLDPPLEGINDTRNEILLALQLHSLFGASEATFLQVSY